MTNKYAALFSPIKVKNFVLENRFALSPVTLNVSVDGFVNDQEIVYFLKRAHSAPLNITSAAHINLEGQIFEMGISCATDKHIDSLKQIATAMKSQGNKAVLQLAHAGRYSVPSLKKLGYVVGPSKQTFFYPYEHEVQELSFQQIKNLIQDYQKATYRAIVAGFDGVEISSAQKLIIQSFFSKLSNHRQDEYGCQTLQTRAKLALDVLKAVNQTIKKYASPDFILGYRATPEETVGNDIGYSIEEFLEFLDMLFEQTHIDYLALASWGTDIYKNKVQSVGKYHNELVNKVVYNHVNQKVPIIVSGGINTPSKCLEAFEYGDIIGLSSVFIVEPDFVSKIKNNQIEQINLNLKFKDLDKLGIPKASFKNMVDLLDSVQSLPQNTRDKLRKLEKNYKKTE